MTASALVDPPAAVKPAHRTHPPYSVTFGPEVADLAALAGFPPDPEQALALDDLFAIDDAGRSVAFEFCVVCARQNLKTALFKMAALGWLFITEQRLIVWSAHEMKTTKEAHRELAELIESTPALSKLLKAGTSHGIMRGNGDESIELRTGQRVIFKARTLSGGRGLTGDKVILDEGMYLKPSHLGSLLPTLSARPDPQVVIGSSAGLIDSAVLRGIRDRGRLHSSPRLAYLEWSAPEGGCAGDNCQHQLGTTGCALDDVALWRRANPALGRRITLDYIEAERQALTPEEFARERLGWWDDPTRSGPFPLGVWESRADTRVDGLTGFMVSKITDTPAVAVDMAWDRKSGAIAVAGKRDDGRVQVEIVDEERAGVTWLAARAAEVVDNNGAAGVTLDPSSAAGALIPAFVEAGVEVTEITGRELAQACGWFYDAVCDGSLVHLAQARLDAAIAGAKVKAVGDAWRWDRRREADISPLMAATLAASSIGNSGASVFFFDDLDDDESEGP